MVRFVIIQDLHSCDSTPESRVDNYCEAILAKTRSAFAVANSEGADVIIAGDIFHRKRPRDVSHHLVNQLMSILGSLSINHNVYAVKGNHDQSSIEDGEDKFPIDTLVRSGLKLLNGEPVNINGEVSLNGLPWSEDGETNVNRLAIKHIQGLVPISVFHQYLIPDSMEFAGDHLRLAKVWDMLQRVTIVGHLHDGYPGGAIENAGKVIINVGALARERMTKEALTRIPHYGFLEITNSGLSFSHHIIPGALTSDKVFDLEKKATVTGEMDKLHKFAQDFSIRLTAAAGADIGSIDELKVLLAGMSLDEEVRHTAIKFLDEAQL